MKVFYKKLFLFIGIIFLIGVILNELPLNKNYANIYLNDKFNFLKKHSDEYQTLFIGSSKINNQIDCILVDSFSTNSKSYNLGGNGCYLLENLQTTEYLIKQNDFKVSKIILELQNKTNISKKNLSSTRSFASFDFATLKFNTAYNYEQKDYRQILYGLISYGLNTFHYNKKVENKDLGHFSDSIITSQRGFFPLDIDPNPSVEQRHLKLLEDPSEIEKRKTAYLKDNKKYPEIKSFSNKMIEIKEIAAAKNIKLILFIVPPAEPDAKELEALAKSINIPQLNFLNPIQNPEFYELKNRWDYGHLNKNGAEILSVKVGEGLKKLKE